MLGSALLLIGGMWAVFTVIYIGVQFYVGVWTSLSFASFLLAVGPGLILCIIGGLLQDYQF